MRQVNVHEAKTKLSRLLERSRPASASSSRDQRAAKIQPTKWDGILAALEFKRLDVVINQVTISEERKKKYDFSVPYTVSGIQTLILKKNAELLQIRTAADLAGKKVGVGLGTNYEQWVKQDVPQAEVCTYEDDPSKFAELRNGRIDAILIDRRAALEYAQKAKDTQLAGDALSRLESGVALRKGEPPPSRCDA
ncbi:MAG TPA: transporter substrate-binding domain-containing protein [Kofleriaceae bacterium]|nr:transporter substrate-binding domain-containing protein [Kofleriaceae bacterium]